VLQRSIINISFKKLDKIVLLFMLIKSELALLDLPFDIGSPIISFLLPIEMIADGRKSFNTDDCSPVTGPVLVFTLLY